MRFYLITLVVFVEMLCISCDISKKPVKVNSDIIGNEISSNQINSKKAQEQPYVILVSIDGFRYDYAEKYQAQNLLGFKASAKRMDPSFPSKTFPNHYAIATGLYPGNNGLVSNSFFNPEKQEFYKISNRKVVEDASYYKGTPLWVLASQQEMVSASMFWVGSEAPVKGVHPTYYFKYDGRISDSQRVNQTLHWLTLPADVRPHLIMLYFSITDDIGHKYGPNSTQMDSAVKQIDATIGQLMNGLQKVQLPVNVIVTSDHGMIEVNTDSFIVPEQLFPKGSVISTSFPIMWYEKDAVKVDSLYAELKKDTTMYSVYLKNEIPKNFHYQEDDPRIGDLVLMPKPPYSVKHNYKPFESGTSTHGYNSAHCKEMGAIFYATGPGFVDHGQIESLKNVDIYPLVANLLNLNFDSNSINGTAVSTRSILIKP